MFLRDSKRKKDGKIHRYWSVVESVRPRGARYAHQRCVLYLGELNDSEQAGWTKALEVFNADSAQNELRSLFPNDRVPPPGVASPIAVRLDEYRLSRPRQFGACWMAQELWHLLALDTFWAEHLPPSREGTNWAQILQVLVAYRWIEPGSEWRCHRQWYERCALGELLGEDFLWGSKDQLYLTLDRLLKHRDALFQHLRQRWQDLFGLKYEVLLYDLTSTYFEGQCPEIPKAEFGYSRDHRPDCRQVIIALVVTPEGFPLAYEVLPGSTSDKTTLRDFLKRIQDLHGAAERIWVMDRGIPTEEVLSELRALDPKVHYLVGTPRARVRQTRDQWKEVPWQKIRDEVEVKLFAEEKELFVVAKGEGRRNKEVALRRQKLAGFLRALRKLRKEKNRDRLLERLGAAKAKAGRAAKLVKIQLPSAGKAIDRSRFGFQLDQAALLEAELYDGHYLLRTNLTQKEPAWLWQLYTRLVDIEAVFRTFKNELHVRPVYHSVGPRVEAHLFVCFLAYCLHVTLRRKLRAVAPGLTATEVLKQLSGIQMLDVELPTTDGHWLLLPRYTQPDKGCQLLLSQLKMVLPPQPPPRLSSEQKLMEPAAM